MKYSRDKAGQSRSAEARDGRSTLRSGLLGGALLLCLFVCSTWSRAEPAIAYAPDSTPIAYEVSWRPASRP